MGDKFIIDNFAHIWARHVQALTGFLISCRERFDGDIDLFLVLCVIGERSFSHSKLRENITYEDWNLRPSIGIEAHNINMQSISDFSGIPRETVRRKLRVLIDKGWVTRDESGFVRATPKARADLAPLTAISIEYLSQMKATFDSV